MSNTRTTARRIAVATSLAIVATTSALAARVNSLDAKPATPVGGLVEPSSKWLEGLKAKHKQFFDAPAPAAGIPLVHVMNYYDTYNKAFGVKDADIDAVLTFYGYTTFFGLNDAMWAKYDLGAFFDITDPATGKPAVANIWKSNPNILGMNLAPASIEALQKRGATFILCNNALTIFSGMVAQKKGLDPKAVYEDMNKNILPGVNLVPGMVVAVEQAQRAGLAYHRQ
jgi:intracellular sulfur oxidation DsrE/DsrF family protein